MLSFQVFSQKSPVLTATILLLLLNACSSYNPGIYKYGSGFIGGEATYITKPVYDSNKVAKTYGGGKYYYSPTGYNRSDNNMQLELNAHRAHTFKYANITYGLFGYYGEYYVTDEPVNTFLNSPPTLLPEKYLGKKNYYGGGLRFSFNLNLPSPSADFRPIGLQMIIGKEYGNFKNFRQELSSDFRNSSDIVINNLFEQENVFAWTWYTEAVLRKEMKTQVGYRLAWTYSSSSIASNFITTVFTQVRRFTFDGSISVNRGVGEKASQWGFLMGLQYQLFK